MGKSIKLLLDVETKGSRNGNEILSSEYFCLPINFLQNVMQTILKFQFDGMFGEGNLNGIYQFPTRIFFAVFKDLLKELLFNEINRTYLDYQFHFTIYIL